MFYCSPNNWRPTEHMLWCALYRLKIFCLPQIHAWLLWQFTSRESHISCCSSFCIVINSYLIAIRCNGQHKSLSTAYNAIRISFIQTNMLVLIFCLCVANRWYSYNFFCLHSKWIELNLLLLLFLQTITINSARSNHFDKIE